MGVARLPQVVVGFGRTKIRLNAKEFLHAWSELLGRNIIKEQPSSDETRLRRI